MKSGGWLKRKLLKLYARIVHEKASPEYIARGWAIGMFYGCLIPFGFQLVLSIPTSFLLRGSKIGATLGTLLTNHLTIFFIYPAQCYVGGLLLRQNHSLSQIKNALQEVLTERSYESLGNLGMDLLLAFFVGAVLLTAIMTPLTYFGVRKIVVTHRKRRELRTVSERKA